MNVKQATFLIISIFNLQTFGSCLISIENGGEKFCVTSWKHVEGKDDEVVSKNFLEKDLLPITGIISKYKSVKFIFNDGVFTSMKYQEGSTKRWATLSNAEKDMIFFLQDKFNVKDTNP